jgi:hypothetical protein
VLSGVAAGAGGVIRPAVARQLGGALKGVATALLPAAGLLGSPMAPRPREGAGSKLGQMIDGLLELELEGLDREGAGLERARRFVGLAATSARQAALAPHDVPPRHVVQTALARSLEEHVPDVLEYEDKKKQKKKQTKSKKKPRGGEQPAPSGQEPTRGSHRTMKSGGDRERHPRAERRRRREQSRSDRVAEDVARQARMKKSTPAPAGERERLEDEKRALLRQLGILKNQKRHADKHGLVDKAAAIQETIHDVSASLARVTADIARLAPGEQELEGIPT